MKYQLVKDGAENSMRLQSIGVVLGTPAKEIKVGDTLMWNFGSTSEVVEIVKETAKTIVVKTKPEDSDKVYERRFNKSRLVCILSK
jgi:hypothetical protein